MSVFYAIKFLFLCSFWYPKSAFVVYVYLIFDRSNLFFFSEKLYDFLNIQLESDLNLKRSKYGHYLLVMDMLLFELNLNFFLSQCGTMK
jgi:hypothetical protein